MFYPIITVTLFVSLAIQSTFAGFAINTPSLVECSPVQISWAQGVGPYTIEVVSATDPCGSALDTISNLTSTVFRYTSDFKPGTEVMLFIADSAGNEAWSGNITVGGSPNGTCTSPSTSVNTHFPVASPSPSTVPSGLAGAINAGSSSSGMLTVHRASPPLLFTILAALLALTL